MRQTLCVRATALWPAGVEDGRLMLFYLAIIAALNLCLGYVWGAYFRPCPRCAKIREFGAAFAGPLHSGRNSDRTAAKVAVAESPASFETDTTAEIETPVDPRDAMADKLEEIVEAATEEIPRDPVTGLVTREHAELLIEQLGTGNAGGDPVTVALVEVDDIDWLGEQASDVIDERILCGVSVIVRESLASNHTAARFDEQQLLLVVPHEDLHQATRRAEELRQRIATTSFVADGRTVQTTVTCALAEVSAERSGKRLLEFLQEALGEAKRYGGNRTFMHDGSSPTPVVPPELEVAAQQLAI